MEIKKVKETTEIRRSYRVTEAPRLQHYGGRTVQPFRVRTWHREGELVSMEVDGYFVKKNGDPGQAEVTVTVFASDRPEWLKPFEAPEGI